MSICVNFKAPSTIPKAYFSKKTGINKIILTPPIVVEEAPYKKARKNGNCVIFIGGHN